MLVHKSQNSVYQHCTVFSTSSDMLSTRTYNNYKYLTHIKYFSNFSLKLLGLFCLYASLCCSICSTPDCALYYVVLKPCKRFVLLSATACLRGTLGFSTQLLVRQSCKFVEIRKVNINRKNWLDSCRKLSALCTVYRNKEEKEQNYNDSRNIVKYQKTISILFTQQLNKGKLVSKSLIMNLKPKPYIQRKIEQMYERKNTWKEKQIKCRYIDTKQRSNYMKMLSSSRHKIVRYNILLFLSRILLVLLSTSLAGSYKRYNKVAIVNIRVNKNQVYTKAGQIWHFVLHLNHLKEKMERKLVGKKYMFKNEEVNKKPKYFGLQTYGPWLFKYLYFVSFPVKKSNFSKNSRKLEEDLEKFKKLCKCTKKYKRFRSLPKNYKFNDTENKIMPKDKENCLTVSSNNQKNKGIKCFTNCTYASMAQTLTFSLMVYITIKQQYVQKWKGSNGKQLFRGSLNSLRCYQTVSYTHLTLPTIYSV